MNKKQLDELQAKAAKGKVSTVSNMETTVPLSQDTNQSIEDNTLSTIDNKSSTSQELNKISSKKELTAEDKAAKKAARLANMKDRDILAMDESLRKPGKKYRLVNCTPGNIERYRSMGYEIAQAGIHKGEGSLSEAVSAFGCAEVEVGRKASSKAVWMETDEENAQILREIEDDKAREQEAQIYKSEIPDDSRIGYIRKDT